MRPTLSFHDQRTHLPACRLLLFPRPSYAPPPPPLPPQPATHRRPWVLCAHSPSSQPRTFPRTFGGHAHCSSLHVSLCRSTQLPHVEQSPPPRLPLYREPANPHTIPCRPPATVPHPTHVCLFSLQPPPRPPAHVPPPRYRSLLPPSGPPRQHPFQVMDFTAPKIGVDPEKALRAFAEGVGMSVDAMWEPVKN